MHLSFAKARNLLRSHWTCGIVARPAASSPSGLVREIVSSVQSCSDFASVRANRSADRRFDSSKATLKPGDQLPAERELAQKFGVSRTAVREAVKALREKGLVEAYSGRGTFITDGTSASGAAVVRPDGEDRTTGRFGESGGVRLILEPGIAALAAERAHEEHLSAMREAFAVMDQCAERSGRLH